MISTANGEVSVKHTETGIRFVTTRGTGPAVPLPVVEFEHDRSTEWAVVPDEKMLVLESRVKGAVVRTTFEADPDFPVIRMFTSVRADVAGVVLTGAPFPTFAAPLESPRSILWIGQHSATYREEAPFALNQIPLVDGRHATELHVGSYPSFQGTPTACGWVAVRTGHRDHGDGPSVRGSGFVYGIDYNGKARVRVSAERGAVTIDGFAEPFGLPLKAGEQVQLPSVFVGLFEGDWDDAADLTHRYAKARILLPAPGDSYPWVQYDSWGYDQDINEANQLKAMDVCRRVGVEAFVLDLGWAERIGDWWPDPAKFPRGLTPLSQRAAETGMRFGVHVTPTQANLSSRVAMEHPDWVIHEVDDYFGAAGLCIGHEPCRDWILEDMSRLVREEGVGYILQDAEDVVKTCYRADHTHGARGSHFAASTQGLDKVLAGLRERFPDLVLENCEDGGVMMTYAMARLYHTSITVDNIGSYRTRQGVYGASYPFPTRYSVRYMQDAPTPYTLRSAMFGGPLILMQRAGEWSEDEIHGVARAIDEYKRWRSFIESARVMHIRPPMLRPDGAGWDAIGALARDGSKALVFAYRDAGGEDRHQFRLDAMDDDRKYSVLDHDTGESTVIPGSELRERGLPVQRDSHGSALFELTAID